MGKADDRGMRRAGVSPALSASVRER
jgi:hypothetical protein